MKNVTFQAWQIFSINPKDTLNKFGSQEYIKNINKKWKSLSGKYHPDKNGAVDGTDNIKKINSAKEYLLSSQSRKDLIYWYLDNQTKINASDSSAGQPKFTSSSAFSWFSIRGFIRALDWLICNLFYIVSEIASFMSAEIIALTMLWFGMLNFYQVLLYIAVYVIASTILIVLLEYLPCISRNIPSITITAAMILYGLTQPASIKAFLLSMSPLSLLSISILLILLMVDFGMKDYPDINCIKKNISIVQATVLVAMAFVSNSFLFCMSMNVLFFYTCMGCSLVSESRFLAYAFTWCFPPDLEFEKSAFKLDPSDIKNSVQSSNQPLKAITWYQGKTITNNTQNQSTHQR